MKFYVILIFAATWLSVGALLQLTARPVTSRQDWKTTGVQHACPGPSRQSGFPFEARTICRGYWSEWNMAGTAMDAGIWLGPGLALGAVEVISAFRRKTHRPLD